MQAFPHLPVEPAALALLKPGAEPASGERDGAGGQLQPERAGVRLSQGYPYRSSRR